MRVDLDPMFNHILITGASSGIGEALALYYAQPGVLLSLSGRNAERLEAVAKLCRERGAAVEAVVMDVRDQAAMERWICRADDERPLDLVVANAGISAGMGESRAGESAAQVRDLFDVNVMGVLNTVAPVLPRMIGRGQGHIALMSSLAGFRGWPGAPAYCATKAAVKTYGEGLRGVLKDAGVEIHVICPGFVKSRMTDVNEFPMPFIMPAERAAAIVAKGIKRGKGRIAFPLPVHFFMWLLSILPDALAQALLKNTPGKSPQP